MEKFINLFNIKLLKIVSKITRGNIMAEVKVPELAESITEGTVAEWLKHRG